MAEVAEAAVVEEAGEAVAVAVVVAEAEVVEGVE